MNLLGRVVHLKGTNSMGTCRTRFDPFDLTSLLSRYAHRIQNGDEWRTGVTLFGMNAPDGKSNSALVNGQTVFNTIWVSPPP